MALQTLQDVFEHQLKDLYSAEIQPAEALPKMVEAAYEARSSSLIEATQGS